MNDNVLTLIKLFSENKLSDIESDISPLINSYFQRDWTILKEGWYIKHFEFIRKFKQVLEAIDSHPDVINEKERVKKCLEFCWKEANFNTAESELFKYQMDVYALLVSYSYSKKWTDNQLKHFNVISDIFLNYNNYFISYTNHFAEDINGTYNKVYKKLLKSEDYTTDELKKSNLLARAFKNYFNISNLRKGFFDRDFIRVSNNISDKIRQNIENTIALVQLISKASFQLTEPNWSYEEYKEYNNSRKKFKQGDTYQSGFTPISFFILIDENPFPKDDLTPDIYMNWKRLAQTETLHYNLGVQTDWGGFTTGCEKVIDGIINFKSEMIRNVPD